MQRFEYTVIPAPAKGEKVRGARTGAERFSYALLSEMNRMAAQGWEYVRAETLPAEERSGLTSRTTVYHNVLVFRREIAAPVRALDAADARDAAAPRAAGPRHEPPQARNAAAASPTAPPLAPPTAAPALTASPRPAAAAAAPATAQADPPTDWPDGPEDDDIAAAETYAARVDNYDEPGFDPEIRADTPADPPPFVQRPPLAAARDDADPRPAFVADTAAPGRPAHRLGPADR